jgi:hypothetical protein
VSKKLLIIVFAVAIVAAVAFVAAPFWIIQPFRSQSPRALQVALWMQWYGRSVTVLALAVALIVLALAWRTAGRAAKLGLALGLLLAVGSAVVARIDYFELYFRPDVNPSFITASQAKLDSGDMVLAIRISGQARAYPIRTMAYHHVVNDTVGGVPVVATY